jgi:hypothetical protein
MPLAYLFQKLSAVHTGHPHVTHHQIKLVRPRDKLKSLGTALGKGATPLLAMAAQDAPQPIQDLGLIIHE